jgi:hypothetical protein
LGRKGKWEYFRAIYSRYQQADRQTKRLMLNEFCLPTGYHRKHAIRILNGPPPGTRGNVRRTLYCLPWRATELLRAGVDSCARSLSGCVRFENQRESEVAGL